MSTTYHGVTDALIIAPGEQLTTANSGLTTLSRTYQCAGTYETTAKGLLVPGYSPADYPLLALQTAPVAQRVGGITIFACTFFGVLSTDAYEKPYEVVTSVPEEVTYQWFDWVSGSVDVGGTIVYGQYVPVKSAGSFVYNSPQISRFWVIPKDQKTKSNPPGAESWSRVPVTILEDNPPASTVPRWMAVKSGQSQPKAADILPLYGFANYAVSLSETPYGFVKLVTEVFQRKWQGSGKRVQPVYHDPGVLIEGQDQGIFEVPTLDPTLSGLSISATSAGWDSTDTTSRLMGTAPVTLTFTPLSELPDYYVSYAATWMDSSLLGSHPTVASGNFGFGPLTSYPPGFSAGGLGNYSQPITDPVTLTVYPERFSGSLQASAVTEFNASVTSAFYPFTTEGLPTSPVLTSVAANAVSFNSLNGAATSYHYAITFDTPVSACGADILYYSVHDNLGTNGHGIVTGTLGSGFATISPGSGSLSVAFTAASASGDSLNNIAVAVHTDRGIVVGGLAS